MRARSELEQFCRRWAPTVFSFTSLFLGDEEVAIDPTISALAEYMNASRTLDMDQMPLPLWKCVVDRVAQDPPSAESRTRPVFDDALMKLDRPERLVFLLRNVFGVSLPWVIQITKWSEEAVASLGASATARMKILLEHPGELELLSLAKGQESNESIATESRNADGFFALQRHTIN